MDRHREIDPESEIYEGWFAAKVEEGIDAADQGEFVEHPEVRKLIEGRYPG